MRNLSDEHIKAYQEKGCLKKLFDIIKEDLDLSFEIRKDNEVMVYYRKGKVLTVKYTDENNYAIKPLDCNYYKNSIKEDDATAITSFDAAHLAYTLSHTNELRTYFRQAKNLVHKHKIGLEFGVQQNIALGNRSFDKRFLVVDMEWQFSQEDIKKEDRIVKTRIDLIVVDTQTNEKGANDIYLAELKVGTGATEGKSGIKDHIERTKKITDKTEMCKTIKNDIENIIDIKSKLGLIDGEKKELNLSSEPKMMIILAYRGDEERERLKQQADIAIKKAQEIGMYEPLIKFFDLQMTI